MKIVADRTDSTNYFILLRYKLHLLNISYEECYCYCDKVFGICKDHCNLEYKALWPLASKR